MARAGGRKPGLLSRLRRPRKALSRGELELKERELRRELAELEGMSNRREFISVNDLLLRNSDISEKRRELEQITNLLRELKK
jgi:hypothetical protein